MKRNIITIDEEKCNGCGACIPDCPEGALQMIDGKARLISDLFCDGLGACIGSCPESAISIEERDAEPYDESRVMENIVRQGANTIKAHLAHLQDHGEDELLREAIAYLVENDIEIPSEFLESKCACGELGDAPSGREAIERLVWEEKKCSEPVIDRGPEPNGQGHGGGQGHRMGHGGGCPGSRLMNFEKDSSSCEEEEAAAPESIPSRLRQWPVQIMLIPPHAPFLDGADLLFAADCVPFAYPDFHEKLLKGRVCLVGCPKLDDAQHYLDKITEMFRLNDIKSVRIAYMEVPCCGGMIRIVEEAMKASGKNIPLAKQKIGIKGDEL
jgi:NAD-dependent dihydropyrimidine dehydrogenase PreA subunit